MWRQKDNNGVALSYRVIQEFDQAVAATLLSELGLPKGKRVRDRADVFRERSRKHAVLPIGRDKNLGTSTRADHEFLLTQQ